MSARGEREHVFRALRIAILDEVRLVDDHAFESECSQPAHVAVEYVVVHDHDIGESIEVLTGAMDDRRRPLRRPELNLSRPVHLHHIRHDDEQRIGARNLRGEQRLRGLAEPGLVRQQVAAMSLAGARNELGLVMEERETYRHPTVGRGRLGQVH
jgi:hypothetical protein